MRTVYCVFPPPCRPKGETQKLWIYAAFDRMRSQDLWDICQAGGKEQGGWKMRRQSRRGTGGWRLRNWGETCSGQVRKKPRTKDMGTKKLCVYVGGVVICKRYIWNRTWSFLILVMKQWNLPSGGDFNKQKGDLVGRIYHPPRSWLFP